MGRFAALAIVALAVVIALHSGSILLILAAICGASGIATLANTQAAPHARSSVPIMSNRAGTRHKPLPHN